MSLSEAWGRIAAIQSMVGKVDKLQGQLAAPGFDQALQGAQASSASSSASAGTPVDNSGGVTGNTKAGKPGPAWAERLIADASAKYGVDKNLIRAVMRAESDFNPGSGSSAGAVGLMQLMPQYVKEQTGFTAQEVRTDNRKNVYAGTLELRSYLRKYHGNIPLSLAAYNAGSGAVAKYGGIPPYGETRAYVKKICAELGIKSPV